LSIAVNPEDEAVILIKSCANVGKFSGRIKGNACSY